MLDIEQINSTIQELENSSTTFDTCIKLASLYTVREHLQTHGQTMVNMESQGETDAVEKELADILPHYKKYCDVKRNWQMKNADKEHVLQELEYVCREIEEFIKTLYSHTDTPEERVYIVQTCSHLYYEFSN